MRNCPNCGHDWMHMSRIGEDDPDEEYCLKCSLVIYHNWALNDTEDMEWDGVFALRDPDYPDMWFYAHLEWDYKCPEWLICECGFERSADWNEDYTEVVSARCWSCDNIWSPS